MRSRLIVALAVLLAAGGLTWRLSTATVDVGPLTIGHQGPVTVGSCRVPIGPIAVVSAASRKVEEREPGGPVGKAVDYEIGHSETAQTLTVVHVDGDTTAGAETLNLTIGGMLVGQNVRQTFVPGLDTAPASETGALGGLIAAATAVRKTGLPATVVLWDPAGSFDFRPGRPGRPESEKLDLRGFTVILDGGGEAARRWVPIAQAAGAACVGLTETRSQG